MFTRTKIICTIGPAVSSYEQILKLIDAGMNVARINFSHGTHDEHLKTIEMLKKARKERQIPLAIMLDTKGPEIRVGMLATDSLELNAGEQFLLVKREASGNQIPVTPPSVIDDITKDMHILFDDGYISANVVEIKPEGVLIEILNSGVLKSQKGINIPHGGIQLPALTKRDIEDIKFGCKEDVDLIAASFIRSPEQVLMIKRLLDEEDGKDILVIAKIENVEGVKNFDGIVQVADGIMVARGDLGVELPVTQVPKLQKMMIRKCYQLFKPVVTATQMLESMINCPRPTRAEVSDVANAIYDSTSLVMLSGETAIGKYPIETVKMMKNTIIEAEKDFNYAEFFSHDLSNKEFNDVSSSVALATVKTAYSTHAQAIIAFTSRGSTARAIGRFRPEMPVIALTPNKKTYNQLAFNWGVVPVFEDADNLKDGFDAASCFALKNKYVQYGDLVVISYGSPFGVSGTTNTMTVDNIGDVLIRGALGTGERVHGPVSIIVSAKEYKHYQAKDRIVVISTCDQSYGSIFEQAMGVVLQNHPEDCTSEQCAKDFAEKYNKPLITRADSAMKVLKEGGLVTLYPSKGLVFKGVIQSEQDMLDRVCH